MTENVPKRDDSSSFSLFKQQPAVIVSYGLITTIAAVIIWSTIPQQQAAIPFVLLPIFVGFLLLARVWTIGLLVLLFLVMLILNEPPKFDRQYSLDAILFSAGTLVFVISACRYYVCTAPLLKLNQPLPRKAKFFSWENWRRPPLPAPLAPRASEHFSYSELVTGLLRALLAVAISLVLMWVVPLNANSPQDFRLTPAGLRAILLCVSLFFIAMVTNGILSVFQWKVRSSAEARIYLHSLVTQDIATDVRLMIKQKLKLRRKRKKG